MFFISQEFDTTWLFDIKKEFKRFEFRNYFGVDILGRWKAWIPQKIGQSLNRKCNRK